MFQLKSKLLILLTLSTVYAQAQYITIAEARTKALGTNVTVRGIITNGGELGTSRFVQDGTAGIGIYSTTIGTLERGDSVEVAGDLGHFNNLLQISNNVTIKVIQKGLPMPAPIQFNYPFNAAFAFKYEGSLVQLNNVTSIKTISGSNCGNTPSSFAGNTNYCLNSSSGTPMRVTNPTAGYGDIINKNVPSGTFSLVGIISIFNNGTLPGGGTTTDPKYYDTTLTTGFQFLVRLYEDFVLPPLPNFLSDPYAINIGQDSITLSFQTQNDGSTRLDYDTNTALSISVGDSTLTKNHIYTLKNLTPATIYYLTATSTNANGVSVSRTMRLATASKSTGEIRIYFTQPVDNSVATFKNAIYLNKTFADTLINYINMAQHTLDLAIYNINPSGLSDFVAALNNAYARGVKVRVVGDGSTASVGLASLDANIGVIQRPVQSSNIMHDKFMIIDANDADPNNAWLWGGSCNLTKAQILADRNNVLFIQDQTLAKAYTIEFEEMFGSNGLKPDAAKAKFGAAKADNTPHEFNIGGRWVEQYFSPSDHTTAHIINTANTANKDEYHCVLSFTRSDIATALRNRAYANVYGAGIVDDTAGSPAAVNVFNILAAANVYSTRMKANNKSSQLHSKYLIVDCNSETSDPIVLTGSHNWSGNAETDNDENTLVIHDDTIANLYYQEFMARYIEVGGTGIHGFANFKATNYKPNPFDSINFRNLTTIKNVTNYTWDFGDGQTATTTNPLHYYTAAGIYTVKLTATDGTLTDVEQQTINVGSFNGIASMPERISFMLYPNPANEYITIESKQIKNTINIYNTLGELIFTTNSLNNTLQIPISNLANGIYYIYINGQSSKFVVKHN
ncbi:MAG: phospholipase D-like domain-containing protein [Bacteroidota bacterium]|nr:phospholipase D-like domain-containing protein [Bacteroidota bacterium]